MRLFWGGVALGEMKSRLKTPHLQSTRATLENMGLVGGELGGFKFSIKLKSRYPTLS